MPLLPAETAEVSCPPPQPRDGHIPSRGCTAPSVLTLTSSTQVTCYVSARLFCLRMQTVPGLSCSSDKVDGRLAQDAESAYCVSATGFAVCDPLAPERSRHSGRRPGFIKMRGQGKGGREGRKRFFVCFPPPGSRLGMGIDSDPEDRIRGHVQEGIRVSPKGTTCKHSLLWLLRREGRGRRRENKGGAWFSAGKGSLGLGLEGSP